MTPDFLTNFAKAIEKNAALVRAATTADAVDLRHPTSDPAGTGGRRDVVLSFRDDATAQVFIAAVKAAIAPPETSAPIAAVVFTPR